MIINFSVNGEPHSLDLDPEIPLLWVLRDVLGLTGTKYGCGMAICGACVVQVGGTATRACITPVGTLQGKAVTTIERVGSPVAAAIQNAWEKHNVVQCGYCQSGQIMSAIALLESDPNPSDDDINAALKDNLCRCHTYARIRTAIHTAAESLASQGAGGAA